MYHKMVLPPSKSFIKKNIKASRRWNNQTNAYHAPNVHSLWLKLDNYRMSIRKRDDFIDAERPGLWNTFIVVLDREHVDRSQGPFVLEIDDSLF